MQNKSWMQPALQTSEAVLMPALEACPSTSSRLCHRRMPPSAPPSVFRPAAQSWEQPADSSASTPAARNGSMAGRSVLRADGIRYLPLISHSCRRKRT